MANSLKFNVEESIWFKEGEEIDNILSVSLEPEISVEEHGDYATIKGALRLEGDFQLRGESIERDLDLEETNDQLAFRSVQEVRKVDDMNGEFEHRFPVEITIPIERVEKLDDIYVIVDSFDYKLPNERCLQLSAELEIIGVKEEGMERTESIERDDEQQGEPLTFDEQFSFEIDSARIENNEMNGAEAKENEATQTDEKIIELEQSRQTGPQIELKGREDKEHIEDHNLLVESLEESDRASLYEKDEQEERNEALETEAEFEDVADEEQEQKEESVRDENALYLTKMLERHEEEFSTLKMRIIQPGDSLESIAEVYDVQPAQLVRMNEIQDDQVEEGQIIYIPARTSKQN